MGLIARESTAPFSNGETADGAEIEAEINKVFTEINGKLSNVNIADAADIAGSKLADTSVAGDKLQADTVTTAKMAAAAVPKAYVATSTTTETMTTSTTFVDVPGITAATMTPGSTSDIIMVDLTFSAESTDGGDDQWVYGFGFNINGAAASDVLAVALWTNQWENGNFNTMHVAWATAAPATTSMVIKPQYKVIDAGTNPGNFFTTTSNPSVTATIDQSKNFRVLIVPTK